MLFSEVYGVYYTVMAEILSEAVGDSLTDRRVTEIVQEKAFGESVLTIPEALKKGTWPLLGADNQTPIQHRPTMPLTTLQKMSDAATNTVQIDSTVPYQNGTVPRASRPVTLPTDGGQYIPQVGDRTFCDDGTSYEIKDVTRWDAKVFPDGPVGPLPTPTCGWSKLPALDCKLSSSSTTAFIEVV